MWQLAQTEHKAQWIRRRGCCRSIRSPDRRFAVDIETIVDDTASDFWRSSVSQFANSMESGIIVRVIATGDTWSILSTNIIKFRKYLCVCACVGIDQTIPLTWNLPPICASTRIGLNDYAGQLEKLRFEKCTEKNQAIFSRCNFSRQFLFSSTLLDNEVIFVRSVIRSFSRLH